MKIQVATVAAVLFSAACWGSLAQAQSPASANVQKHGIAVVDINYIFKNNQKFRSAMDGMKNQFETVDAELKAEQQKIVQLEQQKQSYNPGSTEYNQLDNQVVELKAGLQVKVTQKRKSLVEQEAAIYYQTYLEVKQAIDSYAQHQGIGLVLRFNGDDADPNNRESILRSINKAVHYQNQIDITPDVLGMLNGSQQAGRSTTGARR